MISSLKWLEWDCGPEREQVMRGPKFQGWAALETELERRVLTDGFWWGEARVLRQAAGIRRFGPANWTAVRRRLAAAGLEPVPSVQPLESDPLYVRPIPWDGWERAGRLLLEAYELTDRQVPEDLPWHAAQVRDQAIGRWVGAMLRAGWRLERTEPRATDV
jgi:hypothetical protein